MHLNTTRKAVLAASKIPEKDNDYLLNIIYDRYALRGTAYSLHFFIGVVPDDAKDLLKLSSYVGTVYTFSTPLELEGDGPCENCIKQQKEKVMSRAQVPITATLLDHCANPDIPEFTTMAPAAVEDYLNKHLTWRAVEVICPYPLLLYNTRVNTPSHPQATTGRHVPLAELPQTKVYVMQGKGEHSEDPTVLSSYGNYGHLWDATSGKAGGATESDLGKHMAV
jgi:tyrosinase